MCDRDTAGPESVRQSHRCCTLGCTSQLSAAHSSHHNSQQPLLPRVFNTAGVIADAVQVGPHGTADPAPPHARVAKKRYWGGVSLLFESLQLYLAASLWDLLIPCGKVAPSPSCGCDVARGAAWPAPSSVPLFSCNAPSSGWGALVQEDKWNHAPLPATLTAVGVARITVYGPSLLGWSHILLITFKYTWSPGRMVSRWSGISASQSAVAPFTYWKITLCILVSCRK